MWIWDTQRRGGKWWRVKEVNWPYHARTYPLPCSSIPFATGTVVEIAPMPKVATLSNDSVLVSMLKVVGLACASELRPWLASGAAVTVLARDILLLADGGCVADGEVEGVTVTVVTAGKRVDGGGAEGVLTVASVADTKKELPVNEEGLAVLVAMIVTITTVGNVAKDETVLSDTATDAAVLCATAVTVCICVCVCTSVTVVTGIAGEALFDCPVLALSASSKLP